MLAAEYSWLCLNESDSSVFLTAEMSICHNRESPSETNSINNGSVPAISEAEFDKSEVCCEKGQLNFSCHPILGHADLQ